MAYTVVPQWLVEILGPRLAQGANAGRVMAEQVARSETGSILQVLIGQPQGTEPDPQLVAQLPPMVTGEAWPDVIEELRLATQAPNTLREWMKWRAQRIGPAAGEVPNA